MNFNLTLTSPAYDTTAPKFGSGALDGGYGSVPLAAIPTFPMTIEAWVKAASGSTSSASKTILGGTQSFAIGADTSGHAIATLFVGGTGSTLTTTATIVDGTFHHVRLSITSTTATFWVDGVQAGTASGAYTKSSSTPIFIGGYNSGSGVTQSWPGDIDEVAIFSSQLTATGSSFTPPTSAYTGSEATQTALYHLDGNGNDSQVTPSITLGVTSPAAKFSPGNWKGDTGRGGTVYRQTWNIGAWFSYTWNASAAPQATLLLPSSSTGVMISYYLNGSFTDNVAATGGVTISGITPSASNTLTVYVRNSPLVTRWNNGANVLQVQGLQIDSASTAGVAPAARPWVLIKGDSIPEGYSTTAEQFMSSYAYLVSQGLALLGYDTGVSACASMGYLRAGDTSGDVPAHYVVSGTSGGLGGTYNDATSSWNKIDAGVSLLDTNGQISAYGATGTPPALIYNELLANDAHNSLNISDFQASITQWITAARAAAPGAIIMLQPSFCMYATTSYISSTLGLSYVNALYAAVAAYKAANPADTTVSILDFGASFSATITAPFYVNTDYIHPLATGHALIAPMVLQALQAALKPASVATYAGGFHP